MFFKTIMVVKGDGSIFYFFSRSSPMHRINLFSKKETIKIEPSPFKNKKMKLKKYRE